MTSTEQSADMAATKPDVLYIASPSFAGSTLVTALLAQHPEIATIGELKASALGDIDDYYCSCKVRIIECPFWLEFRDQMRDLGHDFEFEKFGTHFRSDSPHIDRVFRANVRGPVFETIRKLAIRKIPGVRRQFSQVLSANADAMRVVLGLQHGKVFLDGSKDPNRLMFLQESGLTNLRVLHLIRDGRGVSNSMRRHFGLTITQAASEWKRKTIEIETTLSQFDSERVMRISYEQFCSSPLKILDEIGAFSGIAPFVEASSHGQKSQHLLGNDMRLLNAQQVVLDEKWRTAFDRQDHDRFDFVAGDTNREIGYEPLVRSNL